MPTWMCGRPSCGSLYITGCLVSLGIEKAERFWPQSRPIDLIPDTAVNNDAK